MTTEKIAVSVPRGLVSKARKAVRKGAARSLSAYVSRAIEVQTMHDDLDAMLQEMLEETGGPPRKAEIAQAKRDVYGPRPKRLKR